VAEALHGGKRRLCIQGTNHSFLKAKGQSFDERLQGKRGGGISAEREGVEAVTWKAILDLSQEEKGAIEDGGRVFSTGRGEAERQPSSVAKKDTELVPLPRIG